MTYKSRDLGDMSFIDKEGNLVQPSREDYWARKSAKPGVAYAFFDSSAAISEIEELVMNEGIRVTDRPGGGRLEVAVTEVKNINEEIAPELYEFMQANDIYPTFPSKFRDQMNDAKPIKMTDLKYHILAARHEKTDKEAADYLGNVMIDIYQKYEMDKPFNVAIVYRNPEDGYLDFKQD